MATQATQSGAVVFSSLVQTALIEQPIWGKFSQEVDQKVQRVNGNFPSTIKMIRLGQATVTDLTSSYPVLGAGAGDTLSRTEISMSIKKAGISGANSIRIQNFEDKLHGLTIQSGLIQTAKDSIMNAILKDIFTRMIRQKDENNADYGGEALAAGQHVAWATAGTAAEADILAARAFLNGGLVPTGNRHIAYWSDEFTDFMSDANLKPYFQYAGGLGVLAGGELPKVHGFLPYETQSMPYIKPSTGLPTATAATFIGGTSANDTRHSLIAWAKEMVGCLIAGVETQITPIPGGAGDSALEVWAYYYGGVLNKAGVYHKYDSTANA
jgi:hypothetical protein